MMLDIDFGQLRSGFSRNMPFAVLIALVLLAEIFIALQARHEGSSIAARPVDSGQSNIVALGELLYSRYLFPFEIAGLILLVAMIGAIVLTHRSRPGTRGQNVSKQIARRPEDSTRNLNPGVGEGMKL
jgi:NADH-quinone oxidoreductase subunit J